MKSTTVHSLAVLLIAGMVMEKSRNGCATVEKKRPRNGIEFLKEEPLAVWYPFHSVPFWFLSTQDLKPLLAATNQSKENKILPETLTLLWLSSTTTLHNQLQRSSIYPQLIRARAEGSSWVSSQTNFTIIFFLVPLVTS